MEQVIQPHKEKDIASSYFIAGWPNWLRWSLMTPAALSGCIVLAGLIKFLMMGSPDADDEWWRIWADIVQSAAIGWLLVSIAAYMAPRKQLVVAVVFLTIIAVLAGGIMTVSLLFASTGGDKLYTLLHASLLIAGGSFALYSVKSELD